MTHTKQLYLQTQLFGKHSFKLPLFLDLGEINSKKHHFRIFPQYKVDLKSKLCKVVRIKANSYGTLIAQIVFFVKQEGFMVVGGGIHFLQESIKF